MSDKTLRVLAIVPTPYCFGLQNLTLAFFRNMPDWVQSYFLTTRWTDGEFDRRLDALGIPRKSTWMGMFSRRLDWKNLKMTLHCLIKLPLAWWQFLRLYFSFRPDVVYFANHHEVILFWPLLVWIRGRVVCHLHDPPPDIAFQRSSFFVWRRAIGRFLFVSHDVRARTALLGSLREEDAVIYNGVDIHPLALPRRRTLRFSEMFGWPENSPIFGITGQLIPAKGQVDFIEASALACQLNPEMRFVIGGRGPTEYVEELKELVNARGLEERLGLCGWLPRAIDFYEAIDVLVLASRKKEGFGLVLAEAGERGLPSIATASGGAVEVLRDQETGIVVDLQHPTSLAQAMVRLATDAALRQRMGQRARERVVKEFRLGAQSECFAELLKSVHPA